MAEPVFVLPIARTDDGAGPAMLDDAEFDGDDNSDAGSAGNGAEAVEAEGGEDGSNGAKEKEELSQDGVVATADERYVVVDLLDFFPAGTSGTASSAEENQDTLEASVQLLIIPTSRLSFFINPF